MENPKPNHAQDRAFDERDPLSRILVGAAFWGSLLGTFAVLLPAPTAILPPAWSPLCHLILLLLLTGGAARGPSRYREEARFWRDLTAGLGLAAGAALIAASGDGKGYEALVIEILLATAAAAWMLAGARQPDLRHRWRVPKLERALAQPQVFVLVAGLFLYFILLPTPVWPPAGPAPDPRFGLALSGFLSFRWALLWHAASSPRFARIYGFLALGNALLVTRAGLDIVAPEIIGASRLLTSCSFLAGAFFAAAVHARGWPPSSAGTSLWEKIQRADGSLVPFEQTLLAALAFPTLHFLAYEMNFFSPGHRALHDFLVLAWLALLAALAAWQREIWQRRTHALNEERHHAARSLRQIQKELLLNQERVAQSKDGAKKAQQLGEMDFGTLFERCPEMIALNRKADGRYLEVSPAAERLIGYRPSELVGRTPEEVGLWARWRERRELLRQLQDHAMVQDLEVTLRQRRGAKILARLAAAEIDFGGEPCVITVLREGLPEQRTAERLEDGSPGSGAGPSRSAQSRMGAG